jgi:hypothetical protein
MFTQLSPAQPKSIGAIRLKTQPATQQKVRQTDADCTACGPTVYPVPRRVAQAFDPLASPTQWGAPSLRLRSGRALRVLGEGRVPRTHKQRGLCRTDKSRVGSIAMPLDIKQGAMIPRIDTCYHVQVVCYQRLDERAGFSSTYILRDPFCTRARSACCPRPRCGRNAAKRYGMGTK